MYVIMLIVSAMGWSAASEKITADIYDLEGKTKLFTYESERTVTTDAMDFSATFKDLNGEVVANEKARLEQGRLVKYDVVRAQTEEKGSVDVKGNQIVFAHWEKGKMTSSKTTMKDNVLLSANLVPHLQAHWDDFMAKKDIVFSYVVWYRKELVGFKFMYDREENGQVIAKMVPTNLLYRSLVNPLYFAFDKSTKKLVYIKGRTLPKIKKDGAWRDLDAYIKYN